MPNQTQTNPTLRQFLAAKVSELRQMLPKALTAGNRKAVHQSRVSTRRLKAALDLLEPAIAPEDRKPFAKVLRRLRRTLGPLRDLDVMIEHLKEIGAATEQAPAAAWLARHFSRQRTELRQQLLNDTPAGDVVQSLDIWNALDAQVDRAQSAARALIADAVRQQLESFSGRANLLARPTRHARGAKPVDVHELRIAGKLLRYTLELAPPLGFRPSKPVLRAFKKLQEALGLWHDHVVLGERCVRAALDDMLHVNDAQTYGQVLKLAMFCNREGEKHLKLFLEMWAEKGRELDGGIARMLDSTSTAAAAVAV